MITDRYPINSQKPSISIFRKSRIQSANPQFFPETLIYTESSLNIFTDGKIEFYVITPKNQRPLKSGAKRPPVSYSAVEIATGLAELGLKIDQSCRGETTGMQVTGGELEGLVPFSSSDGVCFNSTSTDFTSLRWDVKRNVSCAKRNNSLNRLLGRIIISHIVVVRNFRVRWRRPKAISIRRRFYLHSVFAYVGVFEEEPE
ncbi:hypothetical protein CEXT_378131 [Caerostris extrusa]|uniref:Uncharacterized protein n=1 Tax=Caerostris extrusa TaxID=172846 RepID=A0AAV4SP86_CAEEX|nr:hypothetical protein CEXT_378131 [Caerostris extrusa]